VGSQGRKNSREDDERVGEESRGLGGREASVLVSVVDEEGGDGDLSSDAERGTRTGGELVSSERSKGKEEDGRRKTEKGRGNEERGKEAAAGPTYYMNWQTAPRIGRSCL
jgi:hypothetical protein